MNMQGFLPCRSDFPFATSTCVSRTVKCYIRRMVRTSKMSEHDRDEGSSRFDLKSFIADDEVKI